MYNTGDFLGAIKVFLGLLRDSPARSKDYLLDEEHNYADGSVDVVFPGTDKAFVQDFQVAFAVSISSSSLNHLTRQ